MGAVLHGYRMSIHGNGCGSAKWPVWLKDLLFNWFFEASCNRHDQGYNEGGDEARRLHCDLKFLRAMWRDTFRGSLPLVPVKLLQALAFFFIVRSIGWRRFNYK